MDDASETFGNVRDAIFAGTLRIAQETQVGEVTGRSRGGSGGGGGRKDPGMITVDKGKHAGKTIAAIHAEDPGYVTWLSENSKNSFLKKVSTEFLAGAAA